MRDRIRRSGEEHEVATPAAVSRPPAAVRAPSLEWAAHVGNRAVQRLAREAADEEETEATAAADPAPDAAVAAGAAAESVQPPGGHDPLPEEELPE
jgi:hypothetical protein